ncbi:hypothetical protein HYU96_02585 [Candidatus Daviesbacteria bacterium]|nr:hypothetical protein [Candidatus Daviesbacteria bacterium]
MDIDDDGNWDNGYYNKTLTTGFQYSTQAPDGFRFRTPAGVLTTPMPGFQPGTYYFWRMWNGVTHVYGGGWTVNACLRPWIRVTGDVHSDEAISLPGGP